MSKIHRHLHLQHHRHTGKLLHHRHTSYRGLMVVFVLAGLSMIGLNALARASGQALINIYGTVPVAIPGSPAVISTPGDGSTVTTTPTQVAGSCPLISPQVVIAIDVDGARAGSSVCDSNNVFSLPVTLTVGPHRLLARSYTISNDRGPDSDPVQVSYAPAAPVTATPGAPVVGLTQPKAKATSASSETLQPHVPAITTSDTSPVSLSADEPFSYLGASRTVDWTGTLSGGQAPYHVIIDWGDGTQGEYNVAAGPQQFSHHYDSLHSRNMILYITDAAGHSLTEQFGVAAYSALPSGGGATTSKPTSRSAETTAGLYGLFLTVVCVCAIIWLEAKHSARAAGSL